jgi:hypothetical protein
LGVENTIELARLTNVLYVSRPAQAQSKTNVALFKLLDQRRATVRIPVLLGRSWVTIIEILDGLQRRDGCRPIPRSHTRAAWEPQGNLPVVPLTRG